MRQSALRLLARGAAGGIVSLVALCLFSPATVRAGCTVAHLTPSGGLLYRFGLLAEAGALAQPGPAGPSAPVPCSGPSCSQGTPRPFSSAPPLSRVGMEEWALPALTGDLPEPPAFDLPPMLVRLDRIDTVCSIFHPPRSSSTAFPS